MSPASRLASAELEPSAALCAGFAAGCGCAGFAAGRPDFAGAGAAGCAAGFAVRAGRAAAGLGEDINFVPFLNHLVFAQLELAVGYAFASLHIVFIAVPWTHEVHLGIGEI